MKKSNKKNETKVITDVNPLLANDEKTERKVKHIRKHTKVDKHKEKGKNKIRLRDERAQY